MIEGPGMLQELRNELRVFRQLQSDDFGAVRLDLGTLDRVVVHQDKAVQPKLQFFGERPKVLRFWTPIDPPGRKMFELQRHPRAAVENRANILLAVFAAE